jgi:mono/diheme cytochrome c family protein
VRDRSRSTTRWARRLLLVTAAATLTLWTADALLAPVADGQQTPPSGPPAPARPAPHGTPKGWKFTLPKGNPAKGREVFEKLECYSCHQVAGERFPAPNDAARVGPELASMASHHPAEFFAESIVNPSAVVDDRAWRGADGSSKMPSYNDTITVQELIDVVAYLKALKPPPGAKPHQHHH